MADNVNAQVIAFSNNVVRPACNSLCKTYFRAKAAQAEYNAQGIAALIPNVADPNGEIKDMAGTDGRPIATNQKEADSIAAIGAFISFMEANSNANLNKLLALANDPLP